MSFKDQKPDGCHEMSDEWAMLGATVHIPCNKPATHVVGWKLRKEGPYPMCEPHAYHSVKNRGADDLGEYESGKTYTLE